MSYRILSQLESLQSAADTIRSLGGEPSDFHASLVGPVTPADAATVRAARESLSLESVAILRGGRVYRPAPRGGCSNTLHNAVAELVAELVASGRYTLAPVDPGREPQAIEPLFCSEQVRHVCQNRHVFDDTVPCPACSVDPPIRAREACEFCGGSGRVSREA